MAEGLQLADVGAALSAFILRNWSIVRTGTTAAQKALLFNLRRLRARLDDRAGQGLSEQGARRIAASLNVRASDVADMDARLSGGDQSLSVPLGKDGGEAWGDRLPDPGPDPEDLAQAGHDMPLRVKWLKEALAELSPRERDIIRRRQLDPLGHIGKQLGVSKERVRQIERRALAKLRTTLLRCGHDAADMLRPRTAVLSGWVKGARHEQRSGARRNPNRNARADGVGIAQTCVSRYVAGGRRSPGGSHDQL